MLTQPENTIKLSDEQLLAIEETKSRLTNLEAEISIANKNLKGIKLENEKAIKEKIATGELLSNLNVEVAKLSEEKEKLAKAVIDMDAYLKQASEEDRALTLEQNKITSEQNEREVALRNEEAKLSARAEVLRKEIAELQVEKEKLNTFKEALLAVINTL